MSLLDSLSPPPKIVLPWRKLTGLPVPSALWRGAKFDLDSLILPASIAYLASFTLDSPIRWSLNLIKLAPLVYLRDVMVVILLCMEIFTSVRRRRIERHIAFVIAVIFFHLILGFAFVDNIKQVLFGFKVFLPFILGSMAAVRLHRTGRARQMQVALAALWCVSFLGILLESLHGPMPWKGFEVEIGDVTIQGNRSWAAAGIDRLAGFGRASYDTSLFLLLYSISFFYRVPPALRWIVAILSLGGIIMTTTKVAVIAAVGCLGLMLLLTFRIPYRKWIWALVALAMLCITVLPPVLLRKDVIDVDLKDPVVEFAFASFVQRIEDTWPNGFALLDLVPFPVLGRGIGGIGAAQSYFEQPIFSPGDNLFVYAWVAFGALSILYFALLLRTAIRNRGPFGELRTRFLFFGGVFIMGAAMNVVESAPAFFLIGYWFYFGTTAPTFDESIVKENSHLGSVDKYDHDKRHS